MVSLESSIIFCFVISSSAAATCGVSYFNARRVSISVPTSVSTLEFCFPSLTRLTVPSNVI